MIERRYPSLNALHSFVVAGKHLSFTAAAQDLHVSQGAVSRLVRALEEDLGVLLLRRVGRGLELTKAGEAYHRELTAAFQHIATATRTLDRPTQPSPLIINVLPTFTMRWLVPRMADFRRRYPDLIVELVSGDGDPDLDGRWDLAIRYGRPPWPGLRETLLRGEELAVVCAPSLTSGLHPDMTLETLPPALLLQHTTRPKAWRALFAASGLPEPDLSRCQGFEHFFMLAEAASRGQGFALVPTFLVADDLAAGRLIIPLPQRLVPDGAYYLLTRPGPAQRPQRLFRNWLQSMSNEA